MVETPERDQEQDEMFIPIRHARSVDKQNAQQIRSLSHMKCNDESRANVGREV